MSKSVRHVHAAIAACALGSLAAALCAPGAAAAPGAKIVKATYALERTGPFPPRIDAAMSPVDHAGAEVFLATGGVFHTRHLFTVRGNGFDRPFALTHLSGVAYDGPYGRDWWSSFHAFLEPQTNGDVVLHDTDGRAQTFAASGADYTSPPGLFALLEAVRKGRSGKIVGWRLAHADRSVDLFDRKGRWTKWVRPDGQTVVMKRDSHSALRKLATPEKRVYSFKYGRDGRLAAARIPGKRTFTFRYDADGRLVAIARPRRTQDTSAREWTYVYDDGGRLERVFDSAGARVASIAYDGAGRCASIADALDVAATIAYPDDGEAVVTGRDGFARRILFQDTGVQDLLFACDDGDEFLLESWEHDDAGRRTATVRRFGDRIDDVYSAASDPREGGNVVQSTRTPLASSEDEPRVASYEYHPGTAFVTAIVAADGARTDVDPGFAAGGTSDAGRVTHIDLPPTMTAAGLVRGRQTRTYDTRGRLVEVVAPDGARTTYAYGTRKGETDLLVEVVVGAGKGTDPKTGAPFPNRTTKYAYDAAGNRTREDAGAGSVRTTTFDAWDEPVSQTDPLGVTTVLTHDDAGRVVMRSTPFTDEDGAPVGSGTREDRFSYDTVGRLVLEEQFDEAGRDRTTRYVYGGGNRPTRIVGAGGRVVTLQYDSLGRVVRLVHAPGTADEIVETTQYASDSFDVVRTRAGSGATVEEHDGFGSLRRTVDAIGRVSSYAHDAAGRLIRRTDYDTEGERCAEMRMAYDPAGHVVTEDHERITQYFTGPQWQTERTTTTYTLSGYPDVVSGPTGARTTYAYDAAAQVLRVVDEALGRATQYAYDAGGRLVRRDTVLGVGTEDETTETDTFAWDAATRLVGHTDAAGATWRFAYDSLGRGVVAERPGGAVTRTEHDALGRLRRASRSHPSQPGDEPTTTFLYDDADELAQAVDPEGVTHAYTYDALGRMRSSSRNGTPVETYTYGADGGVATRTDGAGRTVAFEYDGVGRVVRRGTGPSDEQTFTWDGNDRLRTSRDLGSGLSTSVSRLFDSLGNLVQDEQSGGGDVIRSWSAGRVPDSMSVRRAGAFDIEYRYTTDACGRITAVARDGSPYATTTYVAGTRRPQTQTAPGVTTTYAYDAAGRLVEVACDALGVTTADTSSSAVYDADGRMLAQTREDGRGERWEYDALGRLVAHYTDAVSPAAGTPTVFDTLTAYTYDASGRLASVETTGPAMKGPGKVASITYDALGRPATWDGQTLTYAGTSHATNWYESRPAHDPGERRLTIDAFGRVTRVERAGSLKLLGSFDYDTLNRPLNATEEEFTGVVDLFRQRLFDGCRLVAEVSPTPRTGSDGYDLIYVPHPATRGWLANEFVETFVEALTHQTDCRGIVANGYDPVLMQHNESFTKFSPQGLPFFEFPAGSPFRGAPSLSTVVNAPGLASAPIAGLTFDWSGDPRDPFLPRRLVNPPHGLGPWGVPRPQPPRPGPGNGDPVADPEELSTDTRTDVAADNARCEAAGVALGAALARLQRYADKSFFVWNDLDYLNGLRSRTGGRLDGVLEGLAEILEGQESVRGKIDFLRGLDLALTGVDTVAGVAGELKDAKKNFEAMGEAMGKALGSKTAAQLEDAALDFTAAAVAEGGRQTASAIKSANREAVFGGLVESAKGGNELGLSTPGAIGYNIASKLNSLTGGKSLAELLAEYERQFGVGLESRKTLLSDLARIDRAIADRRSFLDELRAAGAAACADAQQQLEALAETWPDVDTSEIRAYLAELKAEIARYTSY